MNAVSYIEKSFGSKARNLSASDVVFYGSLVFIAHLAFIFVIRWLMHQSVMAHVPDELSEEMGWHFAIKMTAELLMEAMLFLIGWLFIAGMAVLFDGRANARVLFGWIGLSSLPMVIFSLFAAGRLWMGVEGVDYSPISEARDIEMLWVAIGNCFSGGVYRMLQTGTDIAYLLIAALITEITHRVCGVSRLRAVLIVGSYVGLLFALNRFAG